MAGERMFFAVSAVTEDRQAQKVTCHYFLSSFTSWWGVLVCNMSYCNDMNGYSWCWWKATITWPWLLTHLCYWRRKTISDTRKSALHKRDVSRLAHEQKLW